jgi:hypothetical protein
MQDLIATKTKRAGDMIQVVEHLLASTKERREEERGGEGRGGEERE